ncbi:sugar transferase [Patescibacteria group bacterium]|nr:sugar transferase [Patescibacteria group bacterium]
MKRAETAFTAALVPLDYLLVFAAALTAYNLRFGWLAELRPVILEIPFRNYLLFSGMVAAVFVLFFAFAGLYGISGPRRLRLEVTRLFLACSTGIMTVIAFIFFRRELFESRFIVLAAWFFSVIYVIVGRILIRLLQRLLLKYGVGVRRVAIVSHDQRSSNALTTAFANHPALGYRVIMHFPQFDDTTRAELNRLVEEDKIDEIVATGADADRETLTRILGFAYSHQLGFKYTADLLTTHAKNTELGDVAGLPFVEIKGTRLDGWGRIFKRVFDVVVALILIIITSPVMLVTAVAIKLDSRGPIFFSRLDDDRPVARIGEHGRSFRYIKFRSMKPRTHSMRYKELADYDVRKDGPLVKIKDDPRITRVGKFIRRYSIDELPELFLVLIGEMSLVGPRPHLPEEVEKYLEHHRRVLSVKPGITGLAQVSGRADLSFEDEVRLDTYYLENWSPWMDLAILIKTPIVVLERKGAF